MNLLIDMNMKFSQKALFRFLSTFSFWITILSCPPITLWAGLDLPTTSQSKKAEKRICTVIIQISGTTSSGRHVQNEVRQCTDSILEVEYLTKPTRSLVLSTTKYNQYFEGAKNTISELKNLKPSPKRCRFEQRVKINWDHQKAEFASCQDDGRFILIKKFNDLIRDLYLEPK